MSTMPLKANVKLRRLSNSFPWDSRLQNLAILTPILGYYEQRQEVFPQGFSFYMCLHRFSFEKTVLPNLTVCAYTGPWFTGLHSKRPMWKVLQQQGSHLWLEAALASDSIYVTRKLGVFGAYLTFWFFSLLLVTHLFLTWWGVLQCCVPQSVPWRLHWKIDGGIYVTHSWSRCGMTEEGREGATKDGEKQWGRAQ